MEYPEDAQGWVIREEDNVLSGCTYLNNFDMEEYFRYIGVDNKVQWDD